MQSRRGWSEIEDDRLLKIIKKYGTKNWSLISDKLSMGTTFERTGKQCRERWHNHLDPDINNQVWSKEEDQTLFEAHRTHGSKWKEISKLFDGRTDNSIKNHFYSTVRKCLRTISKLRGEKNTTITMKSIKPYVLSKIVENTELTNLIVQLGRSKYKDSDTLNLEETVLERISNELARINQQYQSKNKQNSELNNNKAQRTNLQSFNSIGSQCYDTLEAAALRHEQDKGQVRPEDITMKQYFEEFESHPHERSEFVQTHHDSSKHEGQIRDIFSLPNMSNSQELKEQVLNKYAFIEKQNADDSCIFEECQSNFFVSPSCNNKKSFPDLRLVNRASRNSHPSPSHSSRPEERVPMTSSRMGAYREDPMQISFDPHDYWNYTGQAREEKMSPKDAQ